MSSFAPLFIISHSLLQQTFRSSSTLWASPSLFLNLLLKGVLEQKWETTGRTFFFWPSETLTVTTFLSSELLWHLFYSSLRSNRSRLIIYDTFTALSVSSTADFLLIDYFSHDYSSWLILYDILSQINLVCAPDPLVYKLLVQIVFFSFDLG